MKSVLLLIATALSASAQSRLTVKVDPRIELMAVTQILADYGWTGLLNNYDSSYRRDVDAWFAPYKQHPAVKRFGELAKAGYTFDGPPARWSASALPPNSLCRLRPNSVAPAARMELRASRHGSFNCATSRPRAIS